jgi:ATP-dependent Clp endopeptidase proteolytic subunit ClpP
MTTADLRAKMRARVPERLRAGSWYEIKNQDGPTATVRIYDEIGFWGVSAADFAAEIEHVTAGDIEVQINSPGGEVFDGIAIFNALRAHPARVTTRVDGIAASAASVIVQAGDHRVMLDSAQLMIHEAWGMAIGPASDLREFADLLDKQSDVIANIYAARSGRDHAELREMMRVETWLTDAEAVAAGLADEVLVPGGNEATSVAPAAVDGDAVLRALDEPEAFRSLVERMVAAGMVRTDPAPTEGSAPEASASDITPEGAATLRAAFERTTEGSTR